MKLLLCKNINTLGIIGDIVDVSAGYGRNYLVPQGLATEPTDDNVRALADARKVAEEDRIRNRKLLETFAQRLEGVEVTVRARANEDGVLYGSVGTKEISVALMEDGHQVAPDQVVIDSPIRHLDNVSVQIRVAEGLCADVKVWVVRDKASDEEEDAEGSEGGREAPSDDYHRQAD